MLQAFANKHLVSNDWLPQDRPKEADDEYTGEKVLSIAVHRSKN